MGYGNRKPPQGAQVDRGHPLAPSAAFAFNEQAGATATDSITGTVLRTAGGANFRGDGLGCTSTGQGAEVLIPPALQFPTGITLACRVRPVTTPDASTTFWSITANNTNSAPFFVAGLILGGTSAYTLFNAAAGMTTGVTATANVPVSFAGTVSASRAEAYINGISKASGSGQITLTYNATSLLAAGNYTGINRKPASIIEYGYLYNRVLKPDQIAWLHAEPYAMFFKPKRKTYFVSTGGLLLKRRKRAMAA